MMCYWTPFSRTFRATCRAIADGVRLFMVDFGLAGFLEKFEGRFGQRATTALLFLIGLAIASVCINTFYSMAVRPVFNSLASIWNSQAFSLGGYWDLLKNVTILILVLALTSSVLRNMLFKRQFAKTMETTIDMINEKVKGLLVALRVPVESVENFKLESPEISEKKDRT